jgi:hypothetical protein
LRERSREERFDQVFQMVLIVVALSFDILWSAGRPPIAEIAVFMFALTIWAFGNLKGGNIEYPYKIGSFNLSLLLLTNFYSYALLGETTLAGLWGLVISAILLPIVCLALSYSLIKYIGDQLDKEVTNGIVLGGTIGYMISMSLLILL